MTYFYLLSVNYHSWKTRISRRCPDNLEFFACLRGLSWLSDNCMFPGLLLVWDSEAAFCHAWQLGLEVCCIWGAGSKSQHYSWNFCCATEFGVRSLVGSRGGGEAIFTTLKAPCERGVHVGGASRSNKGSYEREDPALDCCTVWRCFLQDSL